MNLYFANRSFDILGMASTVQGSEWPIINDVIKEDIDSSIETLEFDIFYKNATDRPRAKYLTKEGNYILYHGVYGDTCFTIVEMESDPVQKTVHVLAEDAGLDLINEIAPAFTAPTSAKSITYYTDRFLSDDFRVGLNEISGRTRTLSWDSETTMTERLDSLAAQFECEIKFRFEIVEMTVISKWLDIYDRRGKDVAQELRLGREIENIVERRSIANLATALHPTGASTEINGESGPPLTLNGYHYDDGDFYIDGETLKSRTALATWGRYNATKGYNSDHVVRTFSYDTTSKVVLANQAIAYLRQIRDPQVTYDVSLFYLPDNLNLGDTVNLVDDKGELYLSARLLSIEISETNDYRQATFGDFIVKTSGISDRLIEIANKIREEASKAVKYEWVVYADDSEGHNISLSPEGKQWIGIAVNKITEEPDLEHPLLYKWSKIQGEDGEPGQPGQDGTSVVSCEIFYKLSRSSNHPDTVRKIAENGKRIITEDETIVDDLIDSEDNEIVDSDGNIISAYVHHVSRIIEGNFSWTTEIPEAIPGYFLWTKVVTVYSNGEEYIAYSVAASGRGVASTKTEYYQSDSSIEPSGGQWGEEIPSFEEDKTYFSRVETTYTDGTVSVSEPKLDRHLNVTVETKAMAERTDKHFFVNTDGVHVTVGENTPNHGKNVRITNDGMQIRNDTITLAEFTDSKVQLGENDTARAVITAQNTRFYNNDNVLVGAINNQSGYRYAIRSVGIDVASDHKLYEAGDGFSGTTTFTDTDLQTTGSFDYFAMVRVGTIVIRDSADTIVSTGSLDYYFTSNNTTVKDSLNWASCELNLVLTNATTKTYTATITWTSIAGVEFNSAYNVAVSVGYNILEPTSSYAFTRINDENDISSYVGNGSFVAGSKGFASGENAIALGNAQASGNNSIAIGNGARAENAGQIVLGKNSKSVSYDGSNTAPFKIGNGNEWGYGSNLFHIRSNGTPYFYDGVAGMNALTPTLIKGQIDNIHYRSSDLNDYLTPGCYYCPSAEAAQTLSHPPVTNSGFQMLVFRFSTNQTCQVVWQNAANSYLRYRIKASDGTWGSWYALARGAGDLSSYLTTSAASSTYAQKSVVGTIVYKVAGTSGQTQTIASGSTLKNLTSITCAAGVWAVTAHAAFQPGSGDYVSKYRCVAIGTTTANNTYGSFQCGASTGSTVIQTTRYITLSAQTTLYLNVYAQEGATLSLPGCIIEAVRLR